MSEYCKVLIVDDEFIMRQGIKHMIEWEKEGFQIVGEVSNGQEALALVEEIRPHIVLSDIVMPNIDGIEFAEIMGKKYPTIQVIILSSYDKFEYVKATLLHGASDYILKPTLNTENLLKALKKAAEKVPGLILKGQEEMPYASQVEKVLIGYKEKLDTPAFASLFTNTFYRLLAIDLRKICGTNKEERADIRRTIEEYFETCLNYVALPVFLEEGIVCVVLNYWRKDEETIFTDGHKLAIRMQRIYSKTFWVLSRCFSNMQEIKEHYQHDIKAEIHSGFYHPGKAFFAIEDYKEREKPERFAFETYTGYLGKERYQEAFDMFREYIRYLCEQQTEVDKLKNLTKNLLYNYLMEIEKFTVESEDLKEKYFYMIDNAARIDEYEEICTEIFDALAQVLAKRLGMEDYRIVEIKQYVENHYQESLELSGIAQRFNFSYTYLSTYFSQTVKEGFNEYLNKIRIEHACELLRRSDTPIAGIGSSVGYSDHSYFCRVFKKITNETPSNYRKRRNQESR